MHRISGASRHCPLLVIELARDMSSEPNTESQTNRPIMSEIMPQCFQPQTTLTDINWTVEFYCLLARDVEHKSLLLPTVIHTYQQLVYECYIIH